MVDVEAMEAEEEVCDVCGGAHDTEVCPELGLDATSKTGTQLSRARLTLPHNLDLTGSLEEGTLQVVATYDILAKTQFGPFEAKRSTNDIPLDDVFALKVLSKDQTSVLLDCSEENECNWLCFVQAAETEEQQNCIAYQLGINIFYNTMRIIRTGEVLRVWYAPSYAKKIGKPPKPDGTTKVMLGTDIGKLLSTPSKPIELPLGKRKRKMRAEVQEYLESARKSLKTEPEVTETETPVVRRGRGRPRKYPIGSTPTTKPKPLTTDAEEDVENQAESEGETEGGDFKCTRCPKTYPTQAAMVRHLRNHIISTKTQSADPVRTLFCEICNQGFVNASNLSRHMRIHKSTTKTLTCPQCSYSTYRHDILRNHMEAMHGLTYQKPAVKTDFQENSPCVVKRKRGRPRKHPLPDPEVLEIGNENTNNENSSPKRVLPQRHNRGKRMREVLSPFKKGSDKDSDDDSDIEDTDDVNDVDFEVPKKKGSNPEESDSEADIEDEVITEGDTEKGEVLLEDGEVFKILDTEEICATTKSGEIEILSSGPGEETVIMIPSDETQNTAHVLQNIEQAENDENELPSEKLTEIPDSQNEESFLILNPETGELSQTLPQETPESMENTASSKDSDTPIHSESVPASSLGNQGENIELLNTSDVSGVNVDQTGSVAQDIMPNTTSAEVMQVEGLVTSETGNGMIEKEASAVLTEEGTVQVEGLVTSETGNGRTEKEASAVLMEEGTVQVEGLVTSETGNGRTEKEAPAVIMEEGTAQEAKITDSETTTTTLVDNQPDGLQTENQNDQTNVENHTTETTNTRATHYALYLTQDNKTIYGCELCNKKFESLLFVQKHLRKHHKKKPFCKECNETFSNETLLVNHECVIGKAKVIITLVGNEVRFSCTECGKTFLNESYALQHATLHSEMFQCDVCKAKFQTRAGLANHKCTKSKKTHQCDICSQSFRTANYLFRHLAMHTDIFKCNVCGKCFSRKDSMQRHVVKCDPERALEENILVCETCNKAFASQKAFDSHLKGCSEKNKVESGDADTESSYRFSCSVCNKGFSNLRNMKRHENTHTTIFQCTICRRAFGHKDEYLWHIVICENAEKIKTDGFVTCDLCDNGEKFTDPKEFRQHHHSHTHPYQCEKCLKRFRKEGSIHTHNCDPAFYQQGGVTCPVCDKTFSCRANMEKHAVIHGERQFECEVCKKRFFREDYLKDHRCLLPDGTVARVVRRRNRVEVRADEVCHLCGASFTSSSNLNKHMRTHGEKQFQCDICDKKFHYLAYLKAHKFHVHSGGLDLQCTMCGKILKTKTSLKTHIRQFHSGLDPQHQCHICKKRFRQKGNLKTHMFSHSLTKAFTCDMCPKRFKYPDQLARHKLEHTMKQKISCEHCSRQFVKAHEHRRHMQVFHSGTAYQCTYCKVVCSHKHTLMRHFRRKHRGALHLLKEDEYVESLMQPVNKEAVTDNLGLTPGVLEAQATDLQTVEEVAVESAEAIAEAIESAAVACDAQNAPTMSIGQTFTNELGETFTESIITDAEGNETRIVYRTPEGFSEENDLPQVAAEALQSLSMTGEDGTVDLSELQGELQDDDQHTVVIVQIVNQDEEGDMGETYTVPVEEITDTNIPNQLETYAIQTEDV